VESLARCHRCRGPLDDYLATETLCLNCSNDEFLPTSLRINFFYRRSVDLANSPLELHYHRESAAALGQKWQGYEWEAVGVYVDLLRHPSPEGFKRIWIVDRTTMGMRDMELWEARVRRPGAPLFLQKLWWPGRDPHVGMGGLDRKGWTDNDRKDLWAARYILLDVVAKRTGGRPKRAQVLTDEERTTLAEYDEEKDRNKDLSDPNIAKHHLGIEAGRLRYLLDLRKSLECPDPN